ncbi:MAG: histidine kinase [Patulibacter minatonensis]
MSSPASSVPAPALRTRWARWATLPWWLAVAVLTVMGVKSAVDAAEGGTRVVLVALEVAISVALVSGRRRWPASSLVVIYLATLVIVALVPDEPAISSTLAAPLAAYAAGRRSDGRRLVLAAAITAALWLTVSVVSHNDETTVGSIVSVGAFFIAAPIVVGRGVRDRERLRDVLQAKAAAEEVDRLEGAARAQLDERARIAGELHDVVAHALSAMVVQAGGARMQAVRDAPTAGDAFAAVERTGRDALFEIRSLLGVLRESRDDDEILEPQPSLEHLPALIARAERGGLPTTLRVEGVERPLPAGPSLAGYRAIQDALRSARDEGGAGRAEVLLQFVPGGVTVAITDDGPGARGALAVRERVVLYGGELVATPLAGGAGHRVDVRLRAERSR